jgi:hypothetical protein
VPALQVQSPEFKPQFCQKTKKENEFLQMYLPIYAICTGHFSFLRIKNHNSLGFGKQNSWLERRCPIQSMQKALYILNFVQGMSCINYSKNKHKALKEDI